MQFHKFTDGGFCVHKAIDGRVSAWFDKDGKLIDCERTDGAGRSRKPNKQTREYLANVLGPRLADTQRPS
jgi:hypothetical protein